MRERLQKLIARAGLASRRTAEDLIRVGAVRVNGQVVSHLGAKADPAQDRIEVEDRLLRFPPRDVYFLLNKPRNTVCTAFDPKGRRTIFHLLKRVRQRVFSVGRLPYEVGGLLILTSDGGFADTLLRGHLPQTYHFKVKGKLSEDERARFERMSRGRLGSPARLRLVKPGANPWYEVTVVEPRDDWLRTALFRLGHPVEKVKRVALGSLRDPALPLGRFRELNEREVARLAREAGRTAWRPGRHHCKAG